MPIETIADAPALPAASGDRDAVASSRLGARLDASPPLRIAATIVLAILVVALLYVFLKSFTSVLG
jgi:hypothetical protein